MHPRDECATPLKFTPEVVELLVKGGYFKRTESSKVVYTNFGSLFITSDCASLREKIESFVLDIDFPSPLTHWVAAILDGVVAYSQLSQRHDEFFRHISVRVACRHRAGSLSDNCLHQRFHRCMFFQMPMFVATNVPQRGYAK